MSVKSDVYGLLYQNLSLKGVAEVDILNRMHSDPRKKRKCCDNIIKKETNKKISRIIMFIKILTQNFRRCQIFGH